jgi:inner membrane protein
MDNLTHTLIGIAAADAVARSTAEGTGGIPPATRRNYFVTVAAVSSNLPDIDLLYTYGGLGYGKLEYLLHHRGHTHTIVGCILLALLLYACAELWAFMRKHRFSSSDRMGIAGMALLGGMLHLLMDGMNSYGVHPYWPLENRWIYGDAIFIIEPLFWIAAAPLIFTARTWLARGVLALAAAAALCIGTWLHRELPMWIAGFVLVTLVLLVTGWRRSPRVAALTSVSAMAAITLTFFVCARVIERRVELLATTDFAGDVAVDHVLTPLPMNPLCWNLLLVQTGGGRYLVRNGVVATAPIVLPARDCPDLGLGGQRTAPMTPLQASSSPGVEWNGEFAMELADLAGIIEGNCEASRLMQFARVPFAVKREQRQVLGDLRYDREAELGFAEIELSDPPPARCESRAPWIPPREPMLRSILQETGRGAAGKPARASMSASADS